MAHLVRRTSTGSDNVAAPGRSRPSRNRCVLGAEHGVRGDRGKQLQRIECARQFRRGIFHSQVQLQTTSGVGAAHPTAIGGRGRIQKDVGQMLSEDMALFVGLCGQGAHHDSIGSGHEGFEHRQERHH